MKVKKDIQDITDIQRLVDSFYNAVKKDDLLSPIFLERIGAAWQPHLEKMYSFWNAALMGVPGYRGTPFPPHASMQLEERHFRQWLLLFGEAVDAHFSGPKASEAKDRAQLMAKLFLSRIQALDTSKVIPVY